MKNDMEMTETIGIGWSTAENSVGIPVLNQEAGDLGSSPSCSPQLSVSFHIYNMDQY